MILCEFNGFIISWKININILYVMNTFLRSDQVVKQSTFLSKLSISQISDYSVLVLEYENLIGWKMNQELVVDS